MADILIVSDDVHVRNRLGTQVLRGDNNNNMMSVVHNGNDAVSESRKYPYDIVITEMATIDGSMGVAQRLRDSGFNGPIIVQAGTTPTLTDQLEMGGGGITFLHKDTTEAVLRQAIADLTREPPSNAREL